MKKSPKKPPGDRWQRVVFSADCDEDGNCPKCAVDYANCGCPGPTQEGYEYQEIRGVLWARKIRARGYDRPPVSRGTMSTGLT